MLKSFKDVEAQCINVNQIKRPKVGREDIDEMSGLINCLVKKIHGGVEDLEFIEADE